MPTGDSDPSVLLALNGFSWLPCACCAEGRAKSGRGRGGQRERPDQRPPPRALPAAGARAACRWCGARRRASTCRVEPRRDRRARNRAGLARVRTHHVVLGLRAVKKRAARSGAHQRLLLSHPQRLSCVRRARPPLRADARAVARKARDSLVTAWRQPGAPPSPGRLARGSRARTCTVAVPARTSTQPTNWSATRPRALPLDTILAEQLANRVGGACLWLPYARMSAGGPTWP